MIDRVRLSFVPSFVPNVGFMVSLVPPVLLTLLAKGWVSAGIVLGRYLLINVTLGNVVEPGVMARQMKISALLSFLSTHLSPPRLYLCRRPNAQGCAEEPC